MEDRSEIDKDDAMQVNAVLQGQSVAFAVLVERYGDAIFDLSVVGFIIVLLPKICRRRFLSRPLKVCPVYANSVIFDRGSTRLPGTGC